MKIENSESKEKLIQRLRRIEGQVRGVQNMLSNERDCREIMQQLTAISAAVKSTSRSFFRDYASACLTELDTGGQGHEGDREKIVEEMIALLDKTP